MSVPTTHSHTFSRPHTRPVPVRVVSVPTTHSHTFSRPDTRPVPVRVLVPVPACVWRGVCPGLRLSSRLLSPGRLADGMHKHDGIVYPTVHHVTRALVQGPQYIVLVAVDSRLYSVT